MQLPFSQYEVEHATYSIVPYGAQLEIAKRLGKSPTLISQYLSPDDGRESPIFKAAAMLAVLMDIDPEAGRAALEIFTVFVERGGQSVCDCDDEPNAHTCLSTKIRTDARTTAELVDAMQDGHIDARETGRLLLAISEERKVLDQVERLLHRRPVVVAANARRNGHR